MERLDLSNRSRTAKILISTYNIKQIIMENIHLNEVMFLKDNDKHSDKSMSDNKNY